MNPAKGASVLLWAILVSMAATAVAVAAGDDPLVRPSARGRTDLKPFEYVEADVPFYRPGGGRAGDEKWGKMQLPLKPEESIKHMVVPEGFEIRLFASEPDIAKPVAMTWDHRGRLWIAESVDYPNNKQPPGQGNDRIKICQDTDGDGLADRFTIFAENLSIPTGLTFGGGGLIVQQAPDTLLLVDTDGDDRADQRHVLLSGWGTRDTHSGPSNLQWGFDNWIWGMVGYSGFDGTVGGERHAFTMGFYRFKPDGSKLEYLRTTTNNTWGLGFSEEGIVFGSTANNNPSVYLPIPNRHYEAVRGRSAARLGTIALSSDFYPITDQVRQVDVHGGFTAAAGHALYTARSYPRKYWNRTALVNGPTGHLLATFVLEARGSDFVSRNAWNLAASDDEWSAPIMAEVGPDGSVWMIDWYNYIVQHNPTPLGFETGKGNAYVQPLRDKAHGRIYRIVYKNAPPYVPPRLDANNAQGLVAALKNDNLFWRKTAQRLLVERDRRDVAPALIRLAADRSVDEIGLNTAAIHALWSLDGLGLLEGDDAAARGAAEAALAHASAGVRRTALSVLPRDDTSLQAILQADALADEDAQVRLAAFLALAEMPPDRQAGAAIATAISLAANSQDRWIPDAATSAAARHDVSFLTALAAQPTAKPLDESAAVVVRRVAEHYARSAPIDTVASLMASLERADGEVAGAIIEGLSRGWPSDRPVQLDEATETVMLALLERLGAADKGRLIALALGWESRAFEEQAQRISAELWTIIGDADSGQPRRVDAAQQLVGLRGDDAATIDRLFSLITPRSSPELTVGLLTALAASRSPRVGNGLVEMFTGLTPSAKKDALTLLLQRSDWTRSMLRGVEQGKVELDLLALDQKQALAAHPDRLIARRARTLLARGGGLPSPDRDAVLEQYLPLSRRKGDAALGKAVFTKHCAKCHTHGGEGAHIGPDMTGMAVHPKAELLMHILDPSRSVEGNFRTYSVITDAGLVYNGLLASETKTTIELYDAEGKKHVVLRKEIEQLVASPKSLMPEGFEKQASVEEIVNLLEFLTRRGRFLPLPLDKAATIVSTRGMFYRKDAAQERLIFADWSPKTFAGVPFYLVDPQGDRRENVIMLYGPQGSFPPKMPKSVSLPCNSPAKAIHLLSGVSGWGAKQELADGSVSMVVRLHYDDGKVEDHKLLNGRHFADYTGVFDVPQSKLAFKLRGQQIRYLAVTPRRREKIVRIELVKGPDRTAPVVMAVTVETGP